MNILNLVHTFILEVNGVPYKDKVLYKVCLKYMLFRALIYFYVILKT